MARLPSGERIEKALSDNSGNNSPVVVIKVVLELPDGSLWELRNDGEIIVFCYGGAVVGTALAGYVSGSFRSWVHIDITRLCRFVISLTR